MSTVNKRVIAMFYTWYQPEYKMTAEEWMYIAYCLLAWIFAFGLGLLIGFIWARFI